MHPSSCLTLVIDVGASSFGSSSSSDEWIALVSGLDVGAASPPDAQIQMLVEYLTGEAGDAGDQLSPSQISRLIIAGNSFAPMGAGDELDAEGKRPVRHAFILHQWRLLTFHSVGMDTTPQPFHHILQSVSLRIYLIWHE